jgi:hypothetical protein
MPYVPVNVIVDRTLSVNTTITIPYPPQKSQGSFFGTYNHTAAVGDAFFRSPYDFLIVPQENRILLNWRSKLRVDAGQILHLQLEELGTDFYYEKITGVTVKGMVASQLFMVNLGTPQPEDHGYFLKPTRINSAGSLPLQRKSPDVPRNVVIVSSSDDSNVIFRIEGEDMYGRTVIEELQGPEVDPAQDVVDVIEQGDELVHPESILETDSEIPQGIQPEVEPAFEQEVESELEQSLEVSAQFVEGLPENIPTTSVKNKIQLRLGNKAFHKITRIIVSGACKGDISIGFGSRLGLPVFLPGKGYLVREIFSGDRISGGAIEAGETGVPDMQSKDRRGTYAPPQSVQLDGQKSLHLLLSLPNPGNIGAPDYVE